MAVTVLYTAIRSSDFKSVTIQDNGTAWTSGGELDKGNVTGITLSLYGTDKETAIKTVTFTSGERIAFLAGTAVTLLFSDSRLFGTEFAPDNFYTSQLDVTGGTAVSTQVAFDSYFYMRKIVINDYTSAAIPQSTFYEASRKIVGNLVSMFQLDTESSQITIARENMWRKVYNDLAWNYANVI